MRYVRSFQTFPLFKSNTGLFLFVRRVPGALIISVRRNRLVVFLSQDRPNVDGVIDFMHRNGIARADYEVEVLPFGPAALHNPHRH